MPTIKNREQLLAMLREELPGLCKQAAKRLQKRAIRRHGEGCECANCLAVSVLHAYHCS